MPSSGVPLNKTLTKLKNRRWLLLGLCCLLSAGTWLLLTAQEIEQYSHVTASKSADAAIVLGAAVWSDSPSPVFRERINHVLKLYKGKRVRKIIFTGGLAAGDSASEAVAARNYALKNGIPPGDILVESHSRTTYENLRNAKSLAALNHLHTFLIVSDPLHMRRAMDMSNDLEMNSAPSPTQTSMFRGTKERRQFLWREVGYLLQYRAWDRWTLARTNRH